MGCEYVAGGAVLPCRADDRNVLLAGCHHPAVLRVDLIVLLQNAAAEKLVDIFIREIPLSFVLRLCPDIDEGTLQAAESLLFRNTGVGHTVVVVLKQLLLLLRSKVAVARDPVVV